MCSLHCGITLWTVNLFTVCIFGKYVQGGLLWVEPTSLFSVASHWFTSDSSNDIQGSGAKRWKAQDFQDCCKWVWSWSESRNASIRGKVCSVRVMTSTEAVKGNILKKRVVRAIYATHHALIFALSPFPLPLCIPKVKSNLMFAQEHCPFRPLKGQAKLAHLRSILNTLTWLFSGLNERVIHY